MSTLALPFFHWIFFILAANNNSNKSLDGSEISKIGPGVIYYFDPPKSDPRVIIY